MNPKTSKKVAKKKVKKQSKEVKKDFKKKQELFKNWFEPRVKGSLSHMLIEYLDVKFVYLDLDQNLRNGTSVFTIGCSPEYRQATVNIYPIAVNSFHSGDKADIRRLEKGIYHELAHMHTERLHSLAHARYVRPDEIDDAVENVTDLLAEYIKRYVDIIKL